MPRHGLRIGLAVAVALPAFAASAAAYPGLTVVYAPRDGARAIHDGAPGVPGVTGTLRQGPIFDDTRWPASSQIAKVGGRALSRLDTPGMVAMLREGLRDPLRQHGVAIEELVAKDWSVPATLRLRDALDRLGPDARRVYIYVGPSLVAQIGRVDLQRRLVTKHAYFIGVLQRAGAVLLEMYGAGARPFTAAQYAEYPSRWLARFPDAEDGRLHMVIARDEGGDGSRLWAWARATAGGRQILGNGVAAYGVRTTQEGLAWLRQLRAFQAAPDLAPAGERPVPTAGGLSVTRSGRSLRVTLTRPGRVTINLIPVNDQRRRRVVKTMVGPMTDQLVRLPSDIAPGRYAIVAIALGNGLRDTMNLTMVVGRRGSTLAATPLELTRTGRTLYVTVGAGNRVLIRLDPPRGKGRNRAIAQLRGPLTRHPVLIPRDLVKGVHIARAIAVGAGGRQSAAVGYRVR